jgi:hypothetical protein
MTETTTAAQAAPPRRSALVAALRYPLVVGAAIAIVSGLFASILIPAATRVWQDRPKELALKGELVGRISRSATSTLARGRYFDAAGARPRARMTYYTRVATEWRIASSTIASELTTYFHETTLPARWQAYEEAVGTYLQYQTKPAFAPDVRSVEAFDTTALRQHFRHLRFDEPSREQARRLLVAGGSLETTGAFFLLTAERDQIERTIVASDASGFSHGFWIFG